MHSEETDIKYTQKILYLWCPKWPENDLKFYQEFSLFIKVLDFFYSSFYKDKNISGLETAWKWFFKKRAWYVGSDIIALASQI
jgi:hypothetical protein